MIRTVRPFRCSYSCPSSRLARGPHPAVAPSTRDCWYQLKAVRRGVSCGLPWPWRTVVSGAIARRPRSPLRPCLASLSIRPMRLAGRARHDCRDTAGRVLHTSTTNGDGAFASHDLAPGGLYRRRRSCRCSSRPPTQVTVPATGTLPALRIVLTAGGFSEEVVVTGRRVETRIIDTPQKVEIVDATDIDRTVAADLTDVLKKNAGVDVIQYAGVLSGIGIRGFRPQFSGINKRSLLLIDGRPSGVTNLGTLRLDGIDRIEVLKGAASSVYGSSAMGGVVNVITRQSRGKIGGTARVGGGSYGTTEFSGRVGGSASSRVDFDLGGAAFDQRDDYRMGNGVVRPATSYTTYNGSARVGVDLGTLASRSAGRGISRPRHHDARATSQRASTPRAGRISSDRVRTCGSRDRSRGTRSPSSGTTRTTRSHTFNVTTTNPLDQPFLPYLSFESDLGWAGLQIKDAWTLVPRQQPRGRLRLREGHEREPFVHADGRPNGAVLGRQRQAHDGRLRGEHAQAVGRPDGRGARRPLRSHHDRDRRHAVQDELHAVGERLQRLQPQRRHQARAREEPARALRVRARLHSCGSPDADRLHDDHRRRTHADQPGQSRSEAGTQHVVRRRRGVDVSRDTRRCHGLPHGRQGSVHLERRDQQSAAARSDRAVGCQRPGRAHQRSRARGRSSPHVARRRVRQYDPLLQPQGTSDERRGAGHPQRADRHDSRGHRRGRRTAERRVCRAATCTAARTAIPTRPGFPIVDYDDFTVIDASRDLPARATACARPDREQPLRRVLLREARLSRCRARRSRRSTGWGSDMFRHRDRLSAAGGRSPPR